MGAAEEARNVYLGSLAHVLATFGKIEANVGPGHILDFPDVFKLTEGLFLSAWSGWEAFGQELLIIDVAFLATSVVRKDARGFSSRAAARRSSERVLNHPDSPDKFVEWDYNAIVSRATEFLGPVNRYTALPQKADIDKMKRIRNAVAHKSDRAYYSFIKLVSDPSFSLTANQRKGITAGRFLYTGKWGAASVMRAAISTLTGAANHLVP